MQNPIRDICLKIKKFFTLNKSKPDEQHSGLSQKEHDLILKWAGIADERQNAAYNEAGKLIYEDLVPSEITRLLNDPIEFGEISKRARKQAEHDVFREERAKAFANIMEQKSTQALETISQIETDWWVFFGTHEEEKPTAELFEQFLKSEFYITDSQKEHLKVPAIFVDEKIVNPHQFYNDLQRVRQLY